MWGEGQLVDVPLSPAGVWAIDTSHTQVGFSLKHLGISTVHGMFTTYAGEATIGADLASSAVQLTVDMASVTTGNTWRDEHLVGDLFFDVAQFPQMAFVSTALAPAGGGLELQGDLTIRDVTRPVRFDLEFCGSSVFPMDEKLHAGFLATTTISRTEFGIGYGVPLASDDVVVRLDVQLIAPADDA